MSPGWIVGTVLVLWGLSLGSQASSCCDCHKNLTTVCAAPSNSVFVPCPSLDSRDFVLQLLQNHKVVSTFTRTNQSTWSTASPASNVSLTNESAGLGFSVTVLNQSSHGLYVCEGKNTFPPPFRRETGPERVLVLIKGLQCEVQNLKPTERVPEVNLVWVWIIAVVCLCIYSIAVSVISALLWVKLRSAECQNDYINTKPRPAQRQQRRKKKIQVLT